ncbi:discoidin domain-containing protein [Bacillus sp. FSL E2-8895]|uniref:discoidin domain-containing protein n=1 Tax=Bacillus sp. FSL E2-8895 TaxID=2954600 RepID=UPI0030F826B9
MNRRKNRRLQKPIKVFATSAILATTLFTPIMTNHLDVHAETVASQSVNQYEQREFDLPATGSYQEEANRERRGQQKTYMPTGIYIKPNEEVTVELSGTKNIRAIIGTHGYDKEWGKEIELSPGTNKISSPNGGLLGLDNHQSTGTVKVKITQGGSPVPFFELGKHTKADWIAMMDKYPNAHAVQLKSEKAVLTVTQDSAKNYIVNQDPVPLLEAYDKMIGAQDKISGLSETNPNPLHRPTQRMWASFENNREAWGLYATLDGAAFVGATIKETLDVNKIGPGQMHEAGHARQIQPLTWWEEATGGCGMGEVTVNLYTAAAYKALYPNLPSLLEGSNRYDQAFQYLKQTDKDYTKLRDSDIKIVMLWQLYLAYGEEFYANLHKLYRELPDDQLPQTDAEKIQAFIYNTSKVAKQNVLPFFDQWGLKATPETRQKIEALNHPTLIAPIWEATDSKPVKPLAVLSKNTMKASANSEESRDPASNAIDGNPNTIWHSQWNVQNQYPYNLTLELGETQTISQVAYLPRQDGNQNGRILNYNIYTSVDGVKYDKVSSGTWENNSDKKNATFNPVTAKYVKVEVTNGNIGYASAAEVDVLTDSTSIKPYVLPKNTMKATASSEESQNAASKAIDGKTDTMWHSSGPPNQYPYNLTLELDKNQTISKVDYLPRQDWSENGRILAYNIYTSVDGVKYDKVSSGTWENNSDKKNATFNPVTAKYVKVEVINGQNGFASAAEVDIWGY